MATKKKTTRTTKKTRTKKKRAIPALRTITLFDKSLNPTFTLCPGKVTPQIFNRARRTEGWLADPATAKDLKFQYWKRTNTGKHKRYYKQTKPDTKGAKLFTVESWL